MILQALYEYYDRCGEIAPVGMELKELPFLIVIKYDGTFVRVEDTRNEIGDGKKYLVAKSWGRTGVKPQPFHFWDNFSYVIGISPANIAIEKEDLPDEKRKKEEKEISKNKKNHNAFIKYVSCMKERHPDDIYIDAINKFYEKNDHQLMELLQSQPIWENLKKNLTKNLSFIIENELEIIATKEQIRKYSLKSSIEEGDSICLITGHKCNPVTTFTKVRLGNFSDTKLVSFQKKSGYDSYGKEQGNNAPMSEDAEFKSTTALKKLLEYGSHNKFEVGNRTFIFWASSQNELGLEVEDAIFNIFGYSEDPDKGIENVRKVFQAIKSGQLKTNLDDRFYILGVYPANKARIAVSYWTEIPLNDFASTVLSHFEDLDIIDNRKNKKTYKGLNNLLVSITQSSKISDVTPNLPEAVVKSIIQGTPYPYTLFTGCIRRIRAERTIGITRAAILKAYLNRLNDNQQKIKVMLDKENKNQGYLCGRLFAVLDKIQDDANNQHSIRDRYMNAASATPSTVFATILNLSSHHSEKLSNGSKVFYEKLKQEIIDKISAAGFPAHLNLQDQGRFFVGYYHQMQDLFTKKETRSNE